MKIDFLCFVWKSRIYGEIIILYSNTSIGGASLSGLMAWYMITHYPDVYGNAIVFSPSPWTGGQVYTWQEKIDDWSDRKIYLNAGDLETPTVLSIEKLNDLLLKAGIPANNIRMDVEKDEGHWHMTWRKGFKKLYPWIVS